MRLPDGYSDVPAGKIAAVVTHLRRPLAFYRRSGFRRFRRQIEIADDPRLDGTAPRHVARHVPLIE